MLVAVALVAASGLAGCAGGGGVGSGSWRDAAPGPLAPRVQATLVWTGHEVLVVGGDTVPCHPSASCAAPSVPHLRDGAAYDPAADTWRSIAPAPVPVDYALPLLLDGVVYLLVSGGTGRPGAEQAFLAYDVAADRWERLELPAEARGLPGSGWYALAAVGSRLLWYSTSDERGTRPDLLYDPRTRTWERLPADPLGPGYARFAVWTRHELLLLEKELVANPCSEEPCLARAAALDPATGRWRVVPAPPTLSTGYSFPYRGRLVAAAAGSEDGGEVNGWDRSYPNGGILDPRDGAWEALPDGGVEAGEPCVAGVVGGERASYGGVRGCVLDLDAGGWRRIPERAELANVSPSVVAMGRELFAYGGVRWAGFAESELLGGASIWTPPPAPGSDR